jgi:hypothetical protein
MNAQHSTVCITIYTRPNNSSKGRFGMHEYTSEGRNEQMNNCLICLISFILVLLWTMLYECRLLDPLS